MSNEKKVNLIVFISYSHDSTEHKKWTAQLATKLFENGIEVILDQWDLRFGDSPSRFMESGINDADRVLLICTTEYVRKAEAGEGGAGYERMIVTSELAQKVDTDKFVPVTRQEGASHDIPVFLGDRFFADFNDDSQFEVQLEKLVRDLKKMPHIDKPTLDKGPIHMGETLGEIPPKEILISKGVEQLSLDEIYEKASSIARDGDQMTWREIVKQTQPIVLGRLMTWRDSYEGNPPQDIDSLHVAVDEAINEVAPLLIISLIGVISGKDGFNDQRSMLDDLLNISGWNRAGSTILAELPQTLGFIYQSLHGAACFYTDQIERSLSLANMKIKDRYGENYIGVWRDTGLMGWPESLGGNCLKAWEYLYTAPERWQWLNKIFGNSTGYQTSMSGYYLTLNINELTALIADGHSDILRDGNRNSHLDVPVCFLRNSEISEAAMIRLARQPEKVRKIWEDRGISRKSVEDLWPAWIGVNRSWLMSVYHYPQHKLANEKLFEALGD